MEEKNTYERLENSLIEFVERASKQEATAEEVEVLPAVANVLVTILFQTH
ncbi:hypothetical protein IW492_02960 [Enterococcus sp. BWB1-3]|nr:hypothetical protein [Enterococcus sp. BWB1-3]MBL1228192.1 hypothetical protein [Enterococcus sp. BWB1-3]